MPHTGLQPSRCTRIAAQLAFVSCLLAAQPAAAHPEHFILTFGGPESIGLTGSDYTILVEHLGAGIGLEHYSLGYTATGGTVTALDYTGSDSEAAKGPLSMFTIGASPSPQGFCTSIIVPVGLEEWRLGAFAVSTHGTITVVPTSRSVADPVILEISGDMSGSECVLPPHPFAFFVCHKESSSSTSLSCSTPNPSLRRVRPRNRVAGGEFDLGLAAWTQSGLDSAVVSLLDIDGSTTSSAVSATLSTAIDGATGSLISPCFSVAGGVVYSAGGGIQANLGQPRPGVAGIDVQWHSNATCSSPLATSPRVDATPGGNYDEVVQAVTAPAAAKSAELRCTLEVSGATNAPYQALCDSLFLPEPGAGLAPVAALGALCALARGRRRAATLGGAR